MFPTRIVPFFLPILLLLLTLSPSSTSAQTTPKSKCAKGVHIVAVRGNGGENAQGYGITLPLINAIKDAVPHSSNISVSYPKTGTPFDKANQIAVKNEMKLIKSHIKSCPKTPIVLVGYSEGAGITMNVACGTSSTFFTKTPALASKYKKNVIAVIVYADGTRTKGQKYNLGGCNRVGTYPRKNPGGCHTFAPVIQSYCDADDGFCCAGGGQKQAHYTYFKQYDKKVGKYVAKQFKKHKGL